MADPPMQFRDGSGLAMCKCDECFREVPTYSAYERRGKVYCQNCVCNTAEKRAYENWFVRPNS